MIDNECDNSVEFSELYMHPLKAVMGEMNWSTWSQTRERDWCEYVNHGISMSRYSVGDVVARD
jgi:hypothetical protein